MRGGTTRAPGGHLPAAGSGRPVQPAPAGGRRGSHANGRVIVEFAGGLGNQMFQLSAGLAVAHRLGCRVEADVRSYAHDPARAFELGSWSASLPLEIVDKGLPNLDASWQGRLSRRLCWARSGLHIVYERHDPLLQDAPRRRRVYLRGYWQNYHVATAQRRLIKYALEHAAADQRRLPHDSIVVHVRRGDYVTDPHARRAHGALPTDYYRTALTSLRSQLGPLPAAVFSDDPEWCRRNLSDLHPASFLEPGAAVPDLHLMTQGRAHVIANSSYSWWGAFLSDAALAVAPRRWFADGRTLPGALLPPTWRAL